MAERNVTRDADAPASPNRATAAQIREGLAPGRKEARLRLTDGTVLSGWLTSPEAFDAAVAEALRHHAREAIRIDYEEAL